MSEKTVRELSDEWGISRQAIQKRLKKLPEDYQPKKVEGKYVISPKAVELLEKIYEQPTDNQLSEKQQPVVEELTTDRNETDKKANETRLSGDYSRATDNRQPTTERNNQLSLKENPVVKEQQERFINELIKDKQNLHTIIANLEERLKDNQNLLDQQQQLTLQSNKQIEQLQLQLTHSKEEKEVNEEPSSLVDEHEQEEGQLDSQTDVSENKSKKGLWHRLFGH